ncbi:MAG: glycosyltransferase [Chitinophagaceae bacterium]|nr:MAG: glycosyltransferase [Chitinophagaceae bacterium]
MKSPLVSIVMCTYNGQAFIDAQVTSILQQDFQDFELVIVDDHSTDSTYTRLEEWAKSTDKIRLFRNENNVGYNVNFAKAILKARAPFISIADQDDIWMPEKTRLLYEALQQPGVVLAHSVSIRLENGSLNYKKRGLQYHFSGNDTRKLMLFNAIMGHDMMFSADLLPAILPIPERMSYDWWIAFVASTLGTIASVPAAIVHHRIHENNNFFKKTTDARKREMDMDEVWEHFLMVPSLVGSNRLFLEKSLALLRSQTSKDVKFKPSLFWHLFKNRRIFFGHKRRKLPIFSYFKNSVKYAKLNFRDKGTI